MKISSLEQKMVRAKITLISLLVVLLFSCGGREEVREERGYPRSPEGVVNINTASVEELCQLPGVNPSLAERIVEWRREHPFKRVDEIMFISGIGERTYHKLRKYLVVSGESTYSPGEKKPLPREGR